MVADAITGHRRWGRWCAAVLGTTVAALLLVLAINWTVDPFQQYRIATRYAPRFYTLHHRWINPGIAKHAPYESALIGSSIMENTPNDVIAAACGGPAVNLSMPAISAAEMHLMLGTVLRTHRPHRVVLVLDFNAFAGPPDARQDVAGPLPTYLYDANPFNDLPYLLSGTVLHKSLAILLGRHDEEYRSDANAPWFWGYRFKFGTAEVMRGLDLNDLNARYGQASRTLDEMRASFERNILDALRMHPDTHFDLVWPPYSILVWMDFAQRRQLDVTFAFKRYVVDVVQGLPNVDVVDLQAHDEITANLDLYKDLYHFAPSVNAWMMQRTCDGGDTVDARSVGAVERRLRQQLTAWRPPTMPVQ